MSYVSLRADAERMYISPWHFPGMRKGRKTAEVLRKQIVARLFGDDHPGFKGNLADVDAYITVLVDCSRGKHGRALQIAINAYSCGQAATATLDGLTSKRRGRDKVLEAETEADVRQWFAIYRVARLVYLAARAARGEVAIDVLPEGCDSPDYMRWEPPVGSTHTGPRAKQPWRVVKPALVAEPVSTLLSASADAVEIARSAADAANVLRLARVDAEPLIQLPEACGLQIPPEPRESHQQKLVAELDRFVAKLESLAKEAA
jgi:hypothetical protein